MDMSETYGKTSHIINLDELIPETLDDGAFEGMDVTDEWDESNESNESDEPSKSSPGTPVASYVMSYPDGDCLLPPMPSRAIRHATRSWVMTVRQVASDLESGRIVLEPRKPLPAMAPFTLMRRTPPRLVAMGFPDAPWKFLAAPLVASVSQAMSDGTIGLPMEAIEALPGILNRPMAAMLSDNKRGNLTVFLESSACADVPVAVNVSRAIVDGKTVITVESLMARSGMSSILNRAAQGGTLVMADIPAIRACQLIAGRKLPSAVKVSAITRRNAPAWLGAARDIGAGTVSEAMGLSKPKTCVAGTEPNVPTPQDMPDDTYALDDDMDMPAVTNSIEPYDPHRDRVVDKWIESVAEAFDALANGREDTLPTDVPVMSRTPDMLREIGMPDAFWIHDRGHIIRECSPMEGSNDNESHGIPSDVMVGLPELLCRPVAVYEPTTHLGHVNIVVDGATMYGQPITVCVSLKSAWPGIRRPFIRISSIHGKENSLAKIDEAIGRDALFYVDRTAVRSLAKRCALTFSERTMQTTGNPEGLRALLERMGTQRKEAADKGLRDAMRTGKDVQGTTLVASDPSPDVDADGHITSTHGTIRLTVV